MSDHSEPPPDKPREIPESLPREEGVLSGPEGTDTKAINEAEQLSSGKSEDDLAREAREKEHTRNQQFRDTFEGLFLWGIRVAFVGTLAFGATWVWHLLTPYSWQWLTAEQVGHIQNIVTGGVLATLVGDHFQRRLSANS